MELAGFSIQLCRAQDLGNPGHGGNGLGHTLDISTMGGVQGEAETIHSQGMTAGACSRERAGTVLAEQSRFTTELSSG